MKKILLLSLTLLMVPFSSAFGAMSGVENNNSGMTAINAFAGNPLTWSVAQSGNQWIYTYSFVPSGSNRGVSFIDLEVGGTPTGLSYTFNYNNSLTGVAGLTSTTASSTLQAQTIDVRPNPNLTAIWVQPSVSTDPKIQQYETWATAGTTLANRTNTSVSVTTVMNGIQWALPSWGYTSDTSLSWYGMAARDPGLLRGFNSGWTLTLTTSAAPMWGDFYLDGGDFTTNNGWLMARNSGYDSTAPAFAFADGTTMSNTGFIAVPNFAAAPVPIPAAFWLLSSGFSGLLFFRRKKFVA